MARLFAGGWPEFIFHDQQTKRHIGRVRELFCDLELVLLDGDEIVAAGWAVPLRSGQLDFRAFGGGLRGRYDTRGEPGCVISG